MPKATEKQIALAITFLGLRGYDTRYMSGEYKELGAKLSERKGSVRAWLGRKQGHEVWELIKTLKKEGGAS